MGMHVVDSTEFDSAAVPVAVRESSSMRNVNESMRQVSGSFALADPIAFFCECEIPACYSVVWMSASSFDAMVTRQTGWLLAETHKPSMPWRPREPSHDPDRVPPARDRAQGRAA
jgi:hypothetical protein